MSMKLRTGATVEYKDGHIPDCIANGRHARVIRQAAKQGSTRQYLVEIVSCPENWKPEHIKQQIGKTAFWWDTDFIIIRR